MKLKAGMFILAFISTNAIAQPHKPLYGLTYSHSISNGMDTVPVNMHGYRVGFWYQPETWQWRYLNIFMDLTFGHWWVNGSTPNKMVNSYALSPVFRFFLMKNNRFSPFIDASIGLTYLSRTRLGNRNLGMHFSFQDQLGIGVAIGRFQEFSVSLNAIHYSNASLCKHNSGITQPLNVSLQYGFG